MRCASVGVSRAANSAAGEVSLRGRPHQREKLFTLEVRAAMELAEAGAAGPARPARRRVEPR